MTAPFEPHWVQAGPTPVALVHRPTQLAEALKLLAEDPRRVPLAGGTDLWLHLTRHLGDPVELIDLTRVDELRGIAVGDTIRVGGGVTHADIVAAPSIVERAIPLAQACREIGSAQLRNRATIAGNLATASPANDSISALMALGATVELASSEGSDVARRQIAIESFFDGFRSTVMSPGELITSVAIEPLEAHSRGVWAKLGLRAAQAISVVHVGVVIGFEHDGTVAWARVALGSVGPTVELSQAAHEALVGSVLGADAIDRAAQAAAGSVTPIDDGRATASYRRESVYTMVRRCLQTVARDEADPRWGNRSPRLSIADSARVVREARSSSTAIDDSTEISVDLNGRSTTATGAASLTLLDWVRAQGLTGSKEGCAEGECGACTVQLDGQAVMSCLVSAAQADGAQVVTVEGLASDDLHPIQQAFLDKAAVQCGFCIPGFLVASASLLGEFDAPTNEQAVEALAGNLCRCTGYWPILDAVADAGREREAMS